MTVLIAPSIAGVGGVLLHRGDHVSTTTGKLYTLVSWDAAGKATLTPYPSTLAGHPSRVYALAVNLRKVTI